MKDTQRIANICLRTSVSTARGIKCNGYCQKTLIHEHHEIEFLVETSFENTN